MTKGQSSDIKIKNTLKFFKMNEDRFSTLLGIIVVFLVAGMMINYFKSANLKIWKGSLLSDSQPSTISMDEKNTTKNDGNDTYKVVKGDDLWHISERYYKSGYNYVDIIKENKLSKNGLITAGMELKMPKVEARKKTVIDTEPKLTIKDNVVMEKKESGTIDSDTYTTLKGDSLWTISVRSYGDGFKWTKIYWANKAVIGKNPNVLFSGIKLNLPKL
jgi:nucleoid-associated protein YgaU